MKNILLLLSILLLGCTTTQPKTVMVPLAVKCPQQTIPAARNLPIKDLSIISTPDIVMKSYVASIYILQAENQDLKNRLRIYQ